MKWIWDEKRRLYLDSRGVKLTDRELREALDEYIESVQRGMSVQARRYVAGEIGVADLFQFLDEEITALHGASGSIAYGGLEQMGLREWDRVAVRMMPELGYMQRFKMDLHQAGISGEPLSADAIANRASLYAEAAYSEYMNQVVERESDNGVTLGRRICEADGASCEECVAAATDEFIPLDEIPDIGSLACMSNCRCEIEFSVGGEEFRTSDLFSATITGQDKYGGSVELSKALGAIITGSQIQ